MFDIYVFIILFAVSSIPIFLQIVDGIFFGYRYLKIHGKLFLFDNITSTNKLRMHLCGVALCTSDHKPPYVDINDSFRSAHSYIYRRNYPTGNISCFRLFSA